MLPGARRAEPGDLRETVRKLQNIIDNRERQRADDRKWVADNARRIDQIEVQLREQT